MSRSVTTSMTRSDSRPCSNSSTDPICPAHALRIAFQVGRLSRLMCTTTRYSSLPATRASTPPASTARWQTEPLRT